MSWLGVESPSRCGGGVGSVASFPKGFPVWTSLGHIEHHKSLLFRIMTQHVMLFVLNLDNLFILVVRVDSCFTKEAKAEDEALECG